MLKQNHSLAALTLCIGLLTGWCATSVAAQEPEPSTEEKPVAPQLLPPTNQCLETWQSELEGLSPEQKAWRDKLNHGIYRVGVGDTQIARIELLSTASPTSCEDQPDWQKRQTQVLITFFAADGSAPEILYEFVDDDVFYGDRPEIYAAGGTIILHGVDFDGTSVNVPIQLEMLKQLYDAATAGEPTVRPGAGTLLARSTRAIDLTPIAG